jgi:hypothetical protein
MTVPSGRKRIGLDGRVLRPEETVSPAAYRPAGKGRGLHAILEKAEPWRNGKPVPLDGPLKKATIFLLWFRIDDRPIEGSPLWDRSAEIVAPGLAVALRGLAADAHLVLNVRSDRDRVDHVVDPPVDGLEKLLSRYFDWTFRAYVGDNPHAELAYDGRSFKRERAHDLGKWSIVIDECFDAGAIEIWSCAYDAQNLAARIDLEKVNRSLAGVDLAPFTPRS